MVRGGGHDNFQFKKRGLRRTVRRKSGRIYKVRIREESRKDSEHGPCCWKKGRSYSGVRKIQIKKDHNAIGILERRPASAAKGKSKKGALFEGERGE